MWRQTIAGLLRGPAGAFTVFDNDGVTVRGSSVVVCFDHLVAVEVIQRQFGDSIYVSPDFGMRFPVVEVVTFGFERRVHAVIVLCRGHGVFNIPAFEVEAFVSYRADLDEDGGSVIHGSGRLVVHILEVGLLVGDGRNRPLAGREPV